VLYEMLSGQPPFTGPTAPSIIKQHMVTPPRPVANLRPTVPASVSAALERALAKNPGDRFGLVSQFGDALGSSESTPVSAAALPAVSPPSVNPPTTSAPTTGPRPHTERLLLMIGVVLAVALVLVVVFAVWRGVSR